MKSGITGRLVVVQPFLAVQVNVLVHPDHDLGVFHLPPDIAVPVHRRLVGPRTDDLPRERERDMIGPEKTVQFLQIHVFGRAFADNDNRFNHVMTFRLVHIFIIYKGTECLKNCPSDIVF